MDSIPLCPYSLPPSLCLKSFLLHSQGGSTMETPGTLRSEIESFSMVAHCLAPIGLTNLLYSLICSNHSELPPQPVRLMWAWDQGLGGGLRIQGWGRGQGEIGREAKPVCVAVFGWLLLWAVIAQFYWEGQEICGTYLWIVLLQDSSLGHSSTFSSLTGWPRWMSQGRVVERCRHMLEGECVHMWWMRTQSCHVCRSILLTSCFPLQVFCRDCALKQTVRAHMSTFQREPSWHLI